MVNSITTRTQGYIQIGDRSADAGHFGIRLYQGTLQTRAVAYPTHGPAFFSRWEDASDEEIVDLANKVDGAIPPALDRAIAAAARRCGARW